MLVKLPLLVETKMLLVEELEPRSELELATVFAFDEGEFKDNDEAEELGT